MRGPLLSCLKTNSDAIIISDVKYFFPADHGVRDFTPTSFFLAPKSNTTLVARMPVITAQTDAAMDLCLSPDDRSHDARPPAAENSAAACFEGGGDVGEGRRTGAATRLDYGDVTETAQDQDSRPVQVEGVDVSNKPKQVTFAGFMPQMGTKDKNKEDNGGVAVEVPIEIDTSEWALEDWLKDISHATSVASEFGTQVSLFEYEITPEVVPVKVALHPLRGLDVWKKEGLHEGMMRVKEEARKTPTEYKRVDVARPYGKTGPLCTASVHPARVGLTPLETYDRKMMTVGLDLSGVTHGFVTSKVAQSYAVLDELAAATMYYDKYQRAPLARPDGAPALPDADEGLRVCFHPRMENFDYSEYKGALPWRPTSMPRRSA